MSHSHQRAYSEADLKALYEQASRALESDESADFTSEHGVAPEYVCTEMQAGRLHGLKLYMQDALRPKVEMARKCDSDISNARFKELVGIGAKDFLALVDDKKPEVSFVEFANSRTYCDDLNAKLGYDANVPGTPDKGFVYTGHCYIEDCAGDYLLTIGSESEESVDLSALEHKLYAGFYVYECMDGQANERERDCVEEMRGRSRAMGDTPPTGVSLTVQALEDAACLSSIWDAELLNEARELIAFNAKFVAGYREKFVEFSPVLLALPEYFAANDLSAQVQEANPWAKVDAAFERVNHFLDATGALESEVLQQAMYQLRYEITNGMGDLERRAAAAASLRELESPAEPGL